ncbi:hypothetical protein DTL21_20905 [Bremerella cremea]|uniref:Spore coat protein n=1 Tax=Blastopirellula marina TaxID=124 RepID=A0A2S8FKE9_9BACT|nr:MULTISPECIES: hypothetical protein [Pirellulaceae]PQO32659.1 hypothetical protein C5Y83_20885 [Blastopirellula marina]RCS45726.1 hypothetical protein DTL21_20905 [Bremerella cremea]
MFRTLLIAAVIAAGFVFTATPNADARWGRRYYRANAVNYRYARPPRVSVYGSPYYRSYYAPTHYGYRGYGPNYYGGYGYPGYYGAYGYGPGVSFGFGF